MVRLVVPIAGILLTMIGTITLLLAVILVQGYSVPPQAYLLFSSPVLYPQLDRSLEELGPLPNPRPSVETMRDIAFDTYDLHPEARARFSKLPIAYADVSDLLGSYDANTGRITIHQPYLPVFLHEFAHAHFDQKPLPMKLGYLVALLRLPSARDARSAQAKAVLGAEMAVAVQQGRLGRPYNPVLESYARLAELSGGDLDALPDVLKGHYADFLQRGPNLWTERQRGPALAHLSLH